MLHIRSLLLPAIALASVSASAQDISDAYKLSNSTVQGTARSMGFGNTLGSVGGDFSSTSVNPAGLGIYRTSELSLTPSLRVNSANSTYIGNEGADNNVHFNINSFSLVFTDAPKGKRYDRRNWKAVSFAIGMNRTGDFNRNYMYQGKNSTSSASQVFESDANYDPAGAGALESEGYTLGFMGVKSGLLDYKSNSYHSIVPYTNGINQMKSVQENGGADEYTVSLGGNYKERLMLGATIGLPKFRYSRNSSFTETYAGGANPYDFSSLNYSTILDITGGGINAKIGAIYKVNDMFRLGAAFHSPTFYSVTEVSTPMLTTTSDVGTYTVSNEAGYNLGTTFDYNITTPWKSVLSATVLIEKMGFITTDYEYVGYNSMRYQLPTDYNGNNYQQYQDFLNQEIKKTFKGTSNFRVGGEAKINKYFMARAGFGYYGNAFTSYGQSAATSSYTTERIDLSAGIGFRFDHFFADLGYVHSMYQGYEQPYSIIYSTTAPGTVPATIPAAKINYGINNIALTMGVKF